MLPRFSAALVALVLACSPLGSLHARHAWGAASIDEPVRLAVDTDKLGPEAEATRQALLPALEPVVRDAGLRLDDTSSIELRVVVTYMEADSLHDYLFRFDVARDGTVAPNPPAFHCLDCVKADLIDRIVTELPPSLPLLFATEDEQALEHTQAAAPPLTTDASAPTAPPLGTLGKASIGLLGAGLLGAGFGVGLLVRGNEVDARSERERVDFRPAGYATLSVSVAVLITGAVLLALDRRRAKQAVTAGPMVAPGTAGMTFVGRF